MSIMFCPRMIFICLVCLLGGYELGAEARRRSSSPSYSQCSMDDGDRADCGFAGISQRQCRSRECCWRSSRTSGAPWCYHSKRSSHSECAAVIDSRRQECGYPGITSRQCQEQDCCWRPTQTPDTAWCYTPEEDSVSVEGCGRPAIRPSVVSRIIGGRDALPHSWPWQISIHSSKKGHQCGGSLIAQQWVITAAHCQHLFADSGTTVRLGLHFSEVPGKSTVELAADDVYPHPGYQKGGRQILDDLLLIKLSEPVTYTDAISPICLPRPGQVPEVGEPCYATGWGIMDSRGDTADALQQLMVPVLDRAVCNRQDWYDGNVSRDMLCAGYEEGGRDACKGDSGGPLECRDDIDGHWFLAGVTSWGWGCAKEHHPGVYAKLGNYVDWIETTMRTHS